MSDSLSGLYTGNPSVNTTKTLRQLTTNDAKILGKTTQRRREKAAPPPKFHSRNFKTLNSNWTPKTCKATNEQIYSERRDLVCNWFDIWTDSQRKRFLDKIFHQCRKNQYLFVQDWFKERVPLRHLDFTKVLPRFLSLYIFSFLDPRTLSRACMVSWQWKFLSEQDAVWMPKAVRFGWFLPYTPPDNEYGAWKRHYIACIKTLDMEVNAQKNGSDLYGTIADGTKWLKTNRKTTRMDPDEAREVLDSRPPWQPPDKNPRDLDLSRRALVENYNPNDPHLSTALTMHHDKFGLPKNPLRNSAPGPIRRQLGLESANRKNANRILSSEDDPDLKPHQRELLSQSVNLESFEERRMIELTRQSWEPSHTARNRSSRRPDLSGGGDYPIPWKHGGLRQQATSKSFPDQVNPRVIFISSRVPAADILVDAVLFGVVPIVYEYEGTTLDSLMHQLDSALMGRSAMSIGLFSHSEVPWEVRLVLGSHASLDTLDSPELVEFFETISSAVLSPKDGGHVDIFCPLASCEPGLELLTQLNILTGMKFTAPSGVVGNYNHIDSEWLSDPEGSPPPLHYFCTSKLSMWANMADQVKEACRATKSIVSRYFEQKHRDVVSQLVGQIIFDATGQVVVHGLPDIGDALVDGLLQLGKDPKVKNPLEFLGQHLLDQVHRNDAAKPDSSLTLRKPMGGTLAPGATMSAKSLTDHFQLDEAYDISETNTETDAEVTAINQGKDLKEARNKKLSQVDASEDEVDEEIVEDIETEEEEDIEDMGTTELEGHLGEKKPLQIISPEEDETLGMKNPLEIVSPASDDTPKRPVPKPQHSDVPKPSVTMRKKATLRLSRTRAEDLPDKRTVLAREMLSSEQAYLRTLQVIKDVFFMPCKAALDSNRAVVSSHNMQIIFTDPMRLLELSRSLVGDLRCRVNDWNPLQCLADIFIKFSINLKAYVNFLNNYPTILLTIEKSQEQSPQFRSLLRRQEKSPHSKMLTLAELFLAPARRISEYVMLLTQFQQCTPSDHADCADIASALAIYRDLEILITQSKERSEKEREIITLQKKIYGSPILLESNRFFIRQLDVARLKPPAQTVIPELRTYQHIETLGLFLFNDGLVVSRRTTKHFPFERCHEYNYRFDACASLTRLRMEDIADSKYVKNAFRMYTPRRAWICSTDSFDDKYNWMTLVEKVIEAALNN